MLREPADAEKVFLFKKLYSMICVRASFGVLFFIGVDFTRWLTIRQSVSTRSVILSEGPCEGVLWTFGEKPHHPDTAHSDADQGDVFDRSRIFHPKSAAFRGAVIFSPDHISQRRDPCLVRTRAVSNGFADVARSSKLRRTKFSSPLSTGVSRGTLRLPKQCTSNAEY